MSKACPSNHQLYQQIDRGNVHTEQENGHNIKEVVETSILCFGIPSVEFYADNGGEFINIKIDKLMATLRVVTKERKNNREEKSSTY